MTRILVAVAAVLAIGMVLATVVVGSGGRREAERPPRTALGSAALPAVPEPARPPRAEASGRLRRERALAAEREEQALRDAILGPLAAEGVSIDQKLDGYRSALRAAFEGTGKESFLEPAYRGALTEAFLRAESIQEDLAALDPGARQRQIEHIRRAMGYGEEEIARLEELDARREARWENGRAYMEERERITGTFEGPALEEELRHLRERYFAHEAKTIELEEREGFYRFERPRVYGRN